MAQPANNPAAAESHEEIFLARYARLRAWALRLAAHDRTRADDLVQDAFVHFTLARPDLTGVQNLDGYLYRMLRNLNVSHLRRAERLHGRALPVVEYDSAEMSLRATGARDLLRVQDELRACCQYACVRKESSKTGSVLILRFLHGYYPREIALILKSSREAVEERLRVARTEARQYLKDPASLRFMRGVKGRPATDARGAALALPADELLRELRDTIFRARSGACLTEARLDDLYGPGDAAALDSATLAHLVSCPRCIDEANARLGLAPLGERYPTDTLAKETRAKGGDDEGGGGDMTGPGAGGNELLLRCRRRVRAVAEHRPQELCIAVNGRAVATQKIGACVNEQTLSVQSSERVEFIEVISEQEVRLLFLDFDGPAEGSARVELSDDRTLEARVSFAGHAPVVQVVYCDPRLNTAAEADSVKEIAALHEVATEPARGAGTGGARGPRRAQLLWRALARFGRRPSGPSFWLRPGTVTAALACILIAVLLALRLHVPTASAAELLRRAATREATAVADPALVLRRTINYEERPAGASAALVRRRIEVWQSAQRGLRLRRLYDDKNSLIAGAWLKADGTGLVYRRGLQPQELSAQSLAPRQLLVSGEVWLLDLSAHDYAALVGDPQRASVAEARGSYTVSYRDEAVGAALRRAELKLNKADLRATDQTLTVERAGAAREYHFVEGAYELLPAGQVAPKVFEPDAELAPAAAQLKTEVKESAAASDGPAAPVAAVSAASSAVASPELEVEVAYLLNQIRADLGEQVSLTRTAAGALRVEALVETEARKAEVLRALQPVGHNPAVVVDVSTVEEAVKRRAQRGPRREVTRDVEVEQGHIPADEELRRHFAARLVGDERIGEEIEQFAARALSRSRQALLHASALKGLAGRFSQEQAGALPGDARRKWLAMMAGHARAYRREVGALRRELEPVFGLGAGVGGAAQAVGAAELSQAAERLLQMSHSHDAAVRSAFTLSADDATTARIKAAQFWRSLRAAEELAGAIEAGCRD